MRTYTKIPVWERFWRHVDPCRTDNCWLWVGSVNTGGYGQFCAELGRPMQAHNFLNGVPLKGLHTDHVKARGCFHRNCVNPEHLEIVTHLENVRRGDAGAHTRNKTHCPHGHPYDAVNTKYSKDGRRFCRECHRGTSHRARNLRRGWKV